MTEHEVAFCRMYQSTFGESAIADLGQHPTHRPYVAMPSSKLPTVLKSAGLWFCPTHQRWFTASEMLMLKEFPISAAQVAACSGACCSFTTGWTSASQTRHRTRASVVGQAGNAMHVNCVGPVIVVVLLLALELGTLTSSCTGSDSGITNAMVKIGSLKRKRSQA